MHHLLEKLLKKRGIDSTSDMTTDEKKDFDKWQSILSGGDLTVEKIAEFCRTQISLIESQWRNLDNGMRKNERLVLLHTVYRAVHDLITVPAAERESLEKFLGTMLE